MRIYYNGTRVALQHSSGALFFSTYTNLYMHV